MTVPVPPGDLTWLNMDRPNNLMYVHGLLLFDERPDWDAVEAVLQERLVERFPVFGRRATQVDGTWVWQDDEQFSLANHVRRATLDAPGTTQAAQDYISARLSQPFDHDRPLWEIDLVDGLAGPDGSGGAAMALARFHHGIADGIRLVQVMLSLLDPVSDGAAPPAVGRSSSGRGPAKTAGRVARHVASGTVDFVGEMGSAVTRSPAWVTRLRPRNLADHVDVLRTPTKIVDSVTGVASESNKLVNTWRSVGRLSLSGRSASTVWSGTPGVAKKAAWISGIPLAEVRRTGKEHGVTVNDVLIGAVSLGITEYLAAKGEHNLDQLTWLIPVSLRPIDASPPRELGNHFALVLMPMPLGISDTNRLLREVRSRMTRIKNSAEPAVLYGIQRTVAETPAAISVRLTNFVANKCVGILTNVPGPRVPMALAGTEVSGVLGWVPGSGDQPLGLCIFSYNGSINIGITCDAALIPDPEVLAECIERAVYRLATE